MKRKYYKEWAIGDRHGSWTIAYLVESTTKNDSRDRFIGVVCECGIERIVTVSSLKGKKNTHCGCLNGKPNQKNLKHTSEYNSWRMMRLRCQNSIRRDFVRYGGRGIRVCDRWLQGFSFFYEDMGSKPHPSYSLDRINVNGDYCPENCRWATPQQQRQNTRKNSLLFSQKMTVQV